MIRLDPRREAALRIIETSRLLRLLVEQRLKPHGMTRVQYATLSRLERQEGLVQNEIADLLEVQPIAMVRIVDQLSADGLIERRADAEDRRRNRLFLTAAGRQRLAELASFKDQVGGEVFDGIEEREISDLLATLAKLHSNLKTISAAEHDQAAKLRKVRTA